jgi:hypothetical protein
MKIVAFSDIAPYSLIEVDRRDYTALSQKANIIKKDTVTLFLTVLTFPTYSIELFPETFINIRSIRNIGCVTLF